MIASSSAKEKKWRAILKFYFSSCDVVVLVRLLKGTNRKRSFVLAGKSSRGGSNSSRENRRDSTFSVFSWQQPKLDETEIEKKKKPLKETRREEEPCSRGGGGGSSRKRTTATSIPSKNGAQICKKESRARERVSVCAHQLLKPTTTTTRRPPCPCDSQIDATKSRRREGGLNEEGKVNIELD